MTDDQYKIVYRLAIVASLAVLILTIIEIAYNVGVTVGSLQVAQVYVGNSDAKTEGKNGRSDYPYPQ